MLSQLFSSDNRCNLVIWKHGQNRRSGRSDTERTRDADLRNRSGFMWTFPPLQRYAHIAPESLGVSYGLFSRAHKRLKRRHNFLPKRALSAKCVGKITAMGTQSEQAGIREPTDE